jgi:hypothetical protein
VWDEALKSLQQQQQQQHTPCQQQSLMCGMKRSRACSSSMLWLNDASQISALRNNSRLEDPTQVHVSKLTTRLYTAH